MKGNNPVSVNTYPQGRHSSSKLYPLGIGICHAFSPPWGGEAWTAVQSPGEVLQRYKHVPRGHTRHAPRGTVAGANTSPGDVFTLSPGDVQALTSMPANGRRLAGACAKGYKYYELCTGWTRRPHRLDSAAVALFRPVVLLVYGQSHHCCASCVPSQASLPTARPETMTHPDIAHCVLAPTAVIVAR